MPILRSSERSGGRILWPCIIIAALYGPAVCMGQAITPDTAAMQVYQLSLQQVIQMAQSQNKLVKAAREDEKAGMASLRDAQNAQLPQIGIEASYQRFTKLTLYEDGLSSHQSFKRMPDPNSLNSSATASFTVFAGGRLQSAITEQKLRYELAVVGTAEQGGQTAAQAVLLYLDIIRLSKQDSLIAEQVKRAVVRLQNITSLYNNQRVTRSDVLRAELNLSSLQLSQQQTENDITIAKDKLAVQLDLASTAQVTVTDTSLGTQPSMEQIRESIQGLKASPYVLQRFYKTLQLQENGIRAIRSNYYPAVQLYTAYVLNYPNFLFFPPIAQWYSVGFAGIRVQYNLSSIYHNKNKVTAAQQRLRSLQLQRDYIADNVDEEINSLYIKYGESLLRIQVAEKSIEQAAANLRIVSAKYFNQLALLTDLLDADNLYTESRYSLVKAQTDATGYYYRLLYATGNL